MKLTYGKDENGGSRDMFVDGELLCEQVISSDAVEICERLQPMIDALITRTVKMRQTLEGLPCLRNTFDFTTFDRAKCQPGQKLCLRCAALVADKENP